MSMRRPLSQEEESFIQGFVKSDILACGCDGSGYKLNEHQEAVLCQCAKDKMLLVSYEESSLPLSLFSKELVDWNLRQDAQGNDLGPLSKHKAVVKRFMEGYLKAIPRIIGGSHLRVDHSQGLTTKVRNLLLRGKKDSGKSMLAVLVGKEALRAQCTVQYYDWTTLCSLASDYNYRKEQDEIAEHMLNSDLVIIDGVYDYRINNSNFVFCIDRFSVARQKSGKPIIITALSDPLNMRLGPAWESLVGSCFSLSLPSNNQTQD